MSAQIFFNKAKGVRVPVEFEAFKHGGGIYLAISNPTEGVHLALVGSAADMVAKLRRMASLIEAAYTTKDQGHISRPATPSEVAATKPASPTPTDRRPALAELTGDPKHDWPLFVARFHDGPARDVLAAIADLYKKQYQYRPPDIDSVLDANERAWLDFDAIELDDLPKILAADGSLKRGARKVVADALDIKDAGNYRPRIDAVLDFIRDNVEELIAQLYPAPANSNGDSVELLENPDPKSNESNADELPWAVGE